MSSKQQLSPLRPMRFGFDEASSASHSSRMLKRQRMTNRLLTYAEAMVAATRAEAEGRCLSASLELAAHAQELGFSPRLVMWRVQGDPAYQDHWAVAVQPHLVIDPTRIQVDGTIDVLHSIDDYPANYAPARLYPYEEVACSAVSTVKSGRRFSGNFMVQLRWRIFRHELRQARHTRDWAHFGFAMRMWWQFSTRYPVHHLRKSLESRLLRL